MRSRDADILELFKLTWELFYDIHTDGTPAEFRLTEMKELLNHARNDYLIGSGQERENADGH